MARRLFLAIPLPEGMVQDIRGLAEVLGGSCSGMRWTRPENLHLTALFLGDVVEGQLERLLPEFASVASSTPSFGMAATEIVPGPPHVSSPSMLWLSFEPSEEYERLSLALHSATRRTLDLPPPRGARTPHVTLVRSRAGVAGPCAEAASEIEYRQGFEASELILFESLLAPEGSTYVKVRTFPLGAERQN